MPKADRAAATATVKIDPALLTKAKQIVALEGGKLTAYFDKLLRGPIDRDHAKSIKKVVNGQEGGAA